MKITRSGSIAAFALIGTLALAGCAATPSTGTSNAPSASADTTVAGPKIDSSAHRHHHRRWIERSGQRPDRLDHRVQGAGQRRHHQLRQVAGFRRWRHQLPRRQLRLRRHRTRPSSPTSTPRAQTLCAGGAPIDLPVYLSGVALVYNLSGVTDLKLSSATIAKIFTLQIKTWNDPAIAADNAGATLPSTPITVVDPLRRLRHHGQLHELPAATPRRASSRPRRPTPGRSPAPSGQQGGSGVVAAVDRGRRHHRLRRPQLDRRRSPRRRSRSEPARTSSRTRPPARPRRSTPPRPRRPQGDGDLTQVIDYTKITDKSAYPIPLLSLRRSSAPSTRTPPRAS